MHTENLPKDFRWKGLKVANSKGVFHQLKIIKWLSFFCVGIIADLADVSPELAVQPTALQTHHDSQIDRRPFRSMRFAI